MNDPLLSILVPVYKVEHFLPRCLDSLLSQTHQNLEIILVDDGSPDHSGAICDAYAAADPRIKVIHTSNHGAYSARNTALDHAHGDFIGFVDGDDWIDAEMYSTLLNLLVAENADVAQCEMINEGPPQLRQVLLGQNKVYEKEDMARALFHDEIAHGLINKLFRASFWADLRFPGHFYHEDAMTMCQLSQRCRRVVRTDQALYHYNTTNESITRGRRNPLHIQSMQKLFSCYEEAAKEAIPDGDFFLCKEIPSVGRQIRPGGRVTWSMARDHMTYMHSIFKRHWQAAKTSHDYRQAPKSKKLLWHLYLKCPGIASALAYLYARWRTGEHP